MGQTILTSKQHQFLEMVSDDEEITQWFYMTGGTALAEFYLHHRLSEDIDLFSFSQVNERYIDNFLDKITSRLKIKNIAKDHIMGLYTYKILYEDGETLKVDFNEYEFEQVETSDIKYGNLVIDSFYDIAINKLYTICGRFKNRDFIDLYFILKKDEFSIDQLIARTLDKFNSKIDYFYLSSRLLQVVDLPQIHPKMFIPFSFTEMIEYFKKEAKRLGTKALK